MRVINVTSYSPSSTTLSDLIRQRCGLTLSAERLIPPVRRLGYADTDAAAFRLRAEPLDGAAWQALIRELAIGETYFFRDAEKLETAIAAIVAARTEQGRRSISAWSAGCATGEEVYTLAVLIRECMPDSDWRIQLLGTDLNTGALRTARRGLYGQWSLRLPGSAIRAGLLPNGSQRWHVPDSLRHVVDFRWLNLADETIQYPAADLVVCRNALMYFDPAVRTRVHARLSAAVMPGGALVTDDISLTANAPSITVQTTSENGGIAESVQQYALVTEPESLSLYDQARASADTGYFDAALQLLDTASPLDLACTWLRALIYMQQDRPTDAIRVVQRCLYLDPGFALGYLTLGNLYAACNDNLSARRQWLNAARLTAQSAPDDPLPLGEGLTAGDLQTVIGVRAL
ncbi:MAG: CheR family methyltransferase [Aggregatilineales bacterium]